MTCALNLWHSESDVCQKAEPVAWEAWDHSTSIIITDGPFIELTVLICLVSIAFTTKRQPNKLQIMGENNGQRPNNE